MSIQVSQDLLREKNSEKVASRDDSAGWASRGPLSRTFKHGRNTFIVCNFHCIVHSLRMFKILSHVICG